MRALDVTWQKALAQAKRYICRVDADAALVIESSLSLPKSMTESGRVVELTGCFKSARDSMRMNARFALSQRCTSHTLNRQPRDQQARYLPNCL